MKSQYCKSRTFRLRFIFVYFVCGGFRTKIKCVLRLNLQSKAQNPQRLAAVREVHSYERSEVTSKGRRSPANEKFSAYENIWIYSTLYFALSTEKCDTKHHDQGELQQIKRINKQGTRHFISQFMATRPRCQHAYVQIVPKKSDHFRDI